MPKKVQSNKHSNSKRTKGSLIAELDEWNFLSDEALTNFEKTLHYRKEK